MSRGQMTYAESQIRCGHYCVGGIAVEITRVSGVLRGNGSLGRLGRNIFLVHIRKRRDGDVTRPTISAATRRRFFQSAKAAGIPDLIAPGTSGRWLLIREIGQRRLDIGCKAAVAVQFGWLDHIGKPAVDPPVMDPGSDDCAVLVWEVFADRIQ